MDWRTKLSPEDKKILDGLLLKIEKHKSIYESSDNPQLVQMWLILLELTKSSDSKERETTKRMQKVLMPRRTEIIDTIENY